MIGTTGLEEPHFVMLAEAARAVPVLQSGNFSLGVTLMAHLVREAAERLGPDWDIEVLEMHHRMKVDAPAGTAKLLGEAAASGPGSVLSDILESVLPGLTAAHTPADTGSTLPPGATPAGDASVDLRGRRTRTPP